MMKKVPKRRFKGFLNAGDWEQCKFKDIAFKRGKISEADLPYVEFEDINSGIGTLNKNILQKVGHKKGILFEAGDVLFGKLRPYLQNWLLCQFMGIAVGDFWVFQPQIVSSAFLYYLIQSEAYQSVVNISSGTKMPRSSWSLVSETHFSIPKYKEATMIGEFLTSIDKNITLHQRKLEKLQATKKALLYELFPIENSRRPKRRFKGFTGDWEQRKLEGLCDLFTDGDWIESKDQCGSGVRLIQTGNIGITEYLDKPDNKKWISDETFNQLHCKEVFPGDILISRLPEPAGRACIIPHLGTKMITAVDCTIVRTSTNTTASFLVQYLSSQPYFNEVNKCLAGGTRQRISRSALAEFKVLVPSEKAEQDIIGKVFDKFDILITLHQRKLEKLKNLKAAYLNEMFV